jgi:hypothetical protein
MKRRTRAETVERFRRRELADEAEGLCARFVDWAEAAEAELAEARPPLPDELDDRALDAWEPLLAIADAAGGAWPRRGRGAACSLSGAQERDDDSLGVRLLTDLRPLFHPRPVDETAAQPAPHEQLFTSTLLAALHADEEAPWSSYGRHAKPLTPSQLASLLRPFGVHSQTVRIDDATAKGYLRSSLEEPWKRYVTAKPATQPSQRHNPHGYAENDHSGAVTEEDDEEAANPHEHSVVTVLRPESETSGRRGNREGVADVDEDELERLADLSREAQLERTETDEEER